VDILVLQSLGCEFLEKKSRPLASIGDTAGVLVLWFEKPNFCWMKTTITVYTFGQGYGTFL